MRNLEQGGVSEFTCRIPKRQFPRISDNFNQLWQKNRFTSSCTLTQIEWSDLLVLQDNGIACGQFDLGVGMNAMDELMSHYS